MLSDFGIVFFEALEEECCPFFGLLNFEAADKEEMLSVFETLGSEGGNAVRFSNCVLGKASGRGEMLSFFF
jgi:hypothetical protein